MLLPDRVFDATDATRLRIVSAASRIARPADDRLGGTVVMTESVPRLYIFPHAGGSASFYVPFSKAFSAGMKRIAVQYPGASGSTEADTDRTEHPRARATSSTACSTRAPRPDGAYRVLRPQHGCARGVRSDAPVRVSRHARSSALFVSACSAPDRMRTEYFRDLSDDELVKFLIELSGTDPKVLDNKDFVEMILPALRGYYDSIAGYTCAIGRDGVVPDLCVHGYRRRVLPPTRTCAAWSDAHHIGLRPAGLSRATTSTSPTTCSTSSATSSPDSVGLAEIPG